jgi:hypothetical protein
MLLSRFGLRSPCIFEDMDYSAGIGFPSVTPSHKSKRSRPFSPLIQGPELRREQFFQCIGRDFTISFEPPDARQNVASDSHPPRNALAC